MCIVSLFPIKMKQFRDGISEHHSYSVFIIYTVTTLYQHLPISQKQTVEKKSTDHFIIKNMKSKRFEIEESSWNWELSSAVVDMLELVPEEDETLNVEKILYDGLSKRVLLSDYKITTSLEGIGVFCLVLISI